MYQQAIGGTERAAARPLVDVPPAPAGAMRSSFSTLSDRVISGCSLVPVTPVLDVRGFGWTCLLRSNWRAIREEAEMAMRPGGLVATTPIWRQGRAVAGQLARCPATAAVIAHVPGLDGAGFARLAAGTHVPAHRGVTRGLLTCDLGLIVPRDGDPRMRVGDRVVRWAEGETLVFDDTCDHEVWNDAHGTGVVLRLRFRRPLRQPGRWIVDRLLGLRAWRESPTE